jgi:adenosylhomocysteine nucleosidase
MSRAAIIAAMSDELKPLVRGWRKETRGSVVLWRRSHGDGEWIAACAGAGVGAATRALAAVEKEGPLDLVFSVGWAGALRKEFAAGQAYRVSGVVDAATGERFPTAAEGACWLVTSPRVADREEKQRLASATGAGLVDMEAAGIARLAGMRGIPFYCVKGVSDGFAEALPDLNRFIATDGKVRRGRLVLFALLRPWLWPALTRLAENSRKAAQGLKDSLLEILDP